MALISGLVDPDDITSWWDLLNPKYHGLIVTGKLGEPGQGGSIQDWYAHPDLGPEFLRRLVLETDMSIAPNQATAFDWLITGKKGIVFLLPDMDTTVEELQKYGAPIQRVHKSLKEAPTLGGGGGAVYMSVPTRQPNPNAVKIWINWFLSREGQTMLQHAAPNRDSLRIDIPKDMLDPEIRRREDVKYPTPMLVPKWHDVREEALNFADDLVQKWRAQQKR